MRQDDSSRHCNGVSDYRHMSTATWIRQKWPHEASDFTPWLRANLDLVSNCTGLDLMALGQEVSAGGGRADILAWESRTKSKTVIENQLSAADTRHFQQLVSYGESLDARIRIWIAISFNDRIRRVISQANRREETKLHAAMYYLLRIEPDFNASEGAGILLDSGPTEPQIDKVIHTEDERETRRKLIEEFWNLWSRQRTHSFAIGGSEKAYLSRAVDMNEAKIVVTVWCLKGYARRERIRSINRYARRLSTQFPETNASEEWRYDEVRRILLEVTTDIDLSRVESWREIGLWFSDMENQLRSIAESAAA